MSSQDRCPRILVTYAGRIPSVEIGAIIPLFELQKQHLCTFKYKDERLLSFKDIAWCDILFIVRGTSSQALKAAKLAKRHERIVLGYWDDNFLDIPDYSLSYSYYSSTKVKNNINKLFDVTDAFFSPSPKLASKLSNILKKNVQTLPQPTGAEVLRKPKFRDNNLPLLGFASSPDHITVLNNFLCPIISAVAATNIGFKVQIMGPKPNFLKKLPVESTYIPHITVYSDYIHSAANLNWDIGLAPQVDHEFTTYKYFTKFIEYTHIGCAGIYSKLQPYTNVIQDGITGLLVENEVEAWKEAILRLIKDPGLRYRIACNAYEFVQSHHNRKTVTEQYYSALMPYLNCRAPKIGKTYYIIYRITFEFSKIIIDKYKYLYNGSIYLIKTYGFKHFVCTAYKYAWSKFRVKSS